MTNSIKIRSAIPSDTKTILAFIYQKSEFDRYIGAFSGNIRTTEAKIRETIFNQTPFAYVLIAEIAQRSVGFALYYYRYSSFVGRPSICLDDLYIEADMRSRGIGNQLMNYLARIADENFCSHLAWTADARNIRGLNFYQRLGAKIVDKNQNVCYFEWASFKKQHNK
ncbi:N-acetyltransferase family protein [Myxosarcina sp. GI1(2024)]